MLLLREEMIKEAEILRKCVSCRDKHMCQKSRKSRGSCISSVSVLQKVTLNSDINENDTQRTVILATPENIEKAKKFGVSVFNGE